MRYLRQPFRSTVVAYLALFFAVSGGTAFAFVRANQVTSASIVDGTVNTIDMHEGAVRSSTIKDGAVNTFDIHRGAITGAKVAPNSLTGAKINESSLAFD